MRRSVVVGLVCFAAGAFAGGMYVQREWSGQYCQIYVSGAERLAQEACYASPGEGFDQCKARLSPKVYEIEHWCGH